MQVPNIPRYPAFTPSHADVIAELAHLGQTDKAGRPYIEHPRAVAATLTDPEDVIVALLHDVLEDTEVTADMLTEYGLPAHLLASVVAITHAPNEPNVDYWARVRQDERATRVKLADIAHNTAPERMSPLDEATRLRLTDKYRRAIIALTV